MQIIDLSVPLEATASDPEPVRVEYVDHHAGAEILGRKAGLTAQDFPDGMALSLERVALTSHSGTHIDAPAHYGPLCAGQTAKTIDQMPLEWFFGPAVVLRCQGDVSDGPVSREEVMHCSEALEGALVAGSIVLIHTGADRHWGTKAYFTDFRGVSRARPNGLWRRVCGSLESTVGIRPSFRCHARRLSQNKQRCGSLASAFFWTSPRVLPD